MIQLEASDRFLRPADLTRTRRNHRQLQARRILSGAANFLLVASILLAVAWVVRRAKEDSRFALRHLEIAGAHLTSQREVESTMRAYRGANLFRLDTAAVTRDLSALPWVQSAAIEKRLPDTLVIHLTERVPAALYMTGGPLRYVDRTGVVFADLSQKGGDPELPLISGGSALEARQCVEFLLRLKGESPALYSRVSEIRAADGGFRVYDRQLSTWVFLGESDAASKWDRLLRVAAAESYGKGTIAYADLRFRDRLVVRPYHLPDLPARKAAPEPVSGEITN